MISFHGKNLSMVKENNMKNMDDFVFRGIKFQTSTLKVKIKYYKL
jgi:hypothetical protein